MFKSLNAKTKFFYRALKTSILYSFSRSDIGRWGKDKSFNTTWDTRTEMIASMIPEDCSVLEFGAGRMALKRYLPYSCRYTPSDILDRGEGTIICDLNDAVLPMFQHHDFIVFGGVLEYIYDPERLLSNLANCCHVIIATYAVTDFPSQRSILQRRKYGWVNNFNKENFLKLFRLHGFIPEQELLWEKQYIFKFVKDNQTGNTFQKGF